MAVLIIFPVILQTDINVIMLSIEGQKTEIIKLTEMTQVCSTRLPAVLTGRISETVQNLE